MALANTFFRFLVILLGLSHLMCLNAVPVTRTENLMQGLQFHKVMIERNWNLEEPTIAERMDLELHDYPPSVANGRHTPRAP